MKELVKRWKSELPDFWKKVRNVAIALGTSAIAVLTADATFTLTLPLAIIEVCKYVIAIAAAIAGSAQFTKKDSDVNEQV